MDLRFSKTKAIIAGWRIVLLFVLITISMPIPAQKTENVRFEKLYSELTRTDKGLSQNTIHCIIQDQFGFLWFATWDGLNKYDGYNYTIFNEENGLSNQNIQAIVEDKDGLIWIGTEDGLNTYNRVTGEFKVWLHDYRDTTSIVHNRIRTLMVDRKGDIWIGTNRGVSVFNKKTEEFTNYVHNINDPNSLINSWINYIFEDDRGRIWIATFKGLNLFEPNTNSFKHFNSSTGWDCLDNEPVHSIDQGQGENILIGGRTGFSIINLKSRICKKFTHDPLDDNSLSSSMVNTVFYDSYGIIWLGTDGKGVNTYDSKTGVFNRYLNTTGDYDGLSNNRVYSIYQDKSGIIWIGTFNGLNKYDRRSSKFRHHFNNPDDEKSLFHNVIFGFYEDITGEIWVGTENGMVIYNPATGNFSPLEVSPLSEPNTINNGLVRCFFNDSEGNYWIGSLTGLNVYNKESGIVRFYKADENNPGSIPDNSITDIIKDKNGDIWVSTEKGLSRYIRKTDKFVSYYYQPDNPKSMPHNCAYDLHIDEDGIIWIATKGGLCWYDDKADHFHSFLIEHHPDLNSNQLRLQSILEDNDGVLWIGTMGGGLLRLHKKTGNLKIYTEKDGLPNNVVYSPMPDNQGNLWIPTNKGLSKFNINLESFTNYDFKDGLQSNEFNRGASLRSLSGMLYFGGMRGFNEFDPDEIRKNHKPPILIISAFRVFNRQKASELNDNDTIVLNYSDNFFSFEFSALDYANPSKNQYRYFLENFERDWTSTSADDRIAEYTNVPPGTYIFRLKGSNNDGVWNEEGISIIVIIRPPWHKTLLFRLLAILSLAFIIWLMVFIRIKRIKRRHTTEKKVLEIENKYFELEQKALRLQMNPHFIFNTLNSIQSYVINNEADKAIEYLAIFARLMRQILSNSSESYIPLKDEITALHYYLEIEKLRFEEKIEYELTVDEKIDEEFVGVPPMIIQPYVENAIIHGLMHLKGAGQIIIELHLQKETIFCIIQDNGVGRKKSMEIAEESGLKRKSRGMMITKQRLELLNRYPGDEEIFVKIIDLEDDNKQPCGTRVELKIPVVYL